MSGERSPWELTPWFLFWKPKWRRSIYGPWHYPDELFEYANDQDVARLFLEEKFGDA